MIKKSKIRRSDLPVICLIPARAGSKGVHQKNLAKLEDLTLVDWAVKVASDSDYAAVVSTNFVNIKEKTKLKNYEVIKRPENIACDNTEMADVILHAVQNVPEDCIVALLQPTSPFRNPKQLKSLVGIFKNSDCDLLMSVRPIDKSILKSGYVSSSGRFESISKPQWTFTNRQQLPQVYRPTGAFYIFEANWFKKNKSFQSQNIIVQKFDGDDCLDIDTYDDLTHAKAIAKNMKWW